MKRKDFTIQKLMTVMEDCSPEDEQRLVLCYKGESVPFHRSGIYLNTDNKTSFIVEFDVCANNDGLEINDWGYND